MVRQFLRFGAIVVVTLLAVLGLAYARAQAAPSYQDATPTPEPIPITSDQQCLDCHTAPDQIMQLASGESLYLTIDGEAYADSLHGKASVGCTKCHTNVTAYPHEPLAEKDLRQVTINFSQTCRQCHSDQAAKNLDSIHQIIREQGGENAENAAACADCHNPHYTQPPAQPRSKIISTCGRCHSRIAAEYRESVHGAALVGEENIDVPACTDCHGVHTIVDPRTTGFLLKSPELCASCHSNKGRMAKYGINTTVFNTYVADFHGTTVTLFERQSPDQLPNKPLCIDCHGVHNIKTVTDAESTVIKQNLLKTCQKCHPSATANYPDAWLSHYTPSPEHNSLVYYVQLFYQFFIPAVVGGMAVFVAADAGRRIAARIKGGKK
ncbi:MAG TPA: cytochrome c3 family protein [Anaerolineales bacterium]|jgi:predicted CXXCH cytochrome family protein|nr:cytochrome c3 family protein [Anaerolineales bacterium]